MLAGGYFLLDFCKDFFYTATTNSTSIKHSNMSKTSALRGRLII